MRFTLSIDCDNAAFAPVHDDADSVERYSAAASEVARILRATAARIESRAEYELNANVRDTNGNRVGAWSLSEEDASGSDDVSVTLAERAANASHIAPGDVLNVLTEACASYPHDAFRLRSVDGDRSRLRLEAFSVASLERSRWVRIEER